MISAAEAVLQADLKAAEDTLEDVLAENADLLHHNNQLQGMVVALHERAGNALIERRANFERGFDEGRNIARFAWFACGSLCTTVAWVVVGSLS